MYLWQPCCVFKRTFKRRGRKQNASRDLWRRPMPAARGHPAECKSSGDLWSHFLSQICLDHSQLPSAAAKPCMRSVTLKYKSGHISSRSQAGVTTVPLPCPLCKRAAENHLIKSQGNKNVATSCKSVIHCQIVQGISEKVTVP